MLILKVNMFGACYFNTRRVQVSWCPGVLVASACEKYETGDRSRKSWRKSGGRSKVSVANVTAHNTQHKHKVKSPARKEQAVGK